MIGFAPSQSGTREIVMKRLVPSLTNRRSLRLFWTFFFVVFSASSTFAIEIVVDYTYDTNNFFDTREKRDAVEAAAARLSRIIDSKLLSVEPEIEISCGGGTAMCPAPWRIGFEHPGTGEIFEFSTAESIDVDPITDPADLYGFAGLKEDEWLLFVGGRSLAPAALGGTATGLNFTGTFDDLDGPCLLYTSPSPRDS